MTKIKQIHLLAKNHDALLSKMGAEAVLFFKQRFNEQQWVDTASVSWRQRRRSTRGKTLINTGTLRRSIRIVSKTFDTIKIGTDLPYAQIHNEGGVIPITPKMRRFFFHKYYELSGKSSKDKKGKTRSTSRNRAINQDAQYYLNLAITKKSTFRIPKRQFMGQSYYLEQRLTRLAQSEITKILNS